ncbi:hypothetical protein [Kurthia huakuii]|uniref:hypothetical protein n=1 Tax=Kurthia huakuii TaxID=1421019 RepID=UPI000496B5FC|nr:hypothetical protein [Kurthia huakuii]MBM7699004.1 hypothetical protein [Kurthia huakuii]
MLTVIRYLLLATLIAIIVVDVIVTEPILSDTIEWLVIIVLVFLTVQLWLRRYRIIALVFMSLATLIFLLIVR